MKYSLEEIEEYKNQFLENDPWDFFENILYSMYLNEDIENVELHLNGGRKSGKTFRTCDFIARAILGFSGKVDSYLFRWKKSDAFELFAEIERSFVNILNRELNKNELNIQHKIFKLNNNQTRVLGIHNQSNRQQIKLTGIKRAQNKKYVIIVLEECYEFTDDEILAIQHAIGGYKNIITIYISNPNTLNTPYLKRISTVLQHDETILRDKGYQAKRVENKLYFYNNWRINPFITNSDVLTLSQTWEIDAERAKVVDYGVPGVEAGRIYSNEMKFIKKDKLENLPWPNQITVGVDWGDGQTEDGSATTAMILGITNKKQQIVLKEYYHHNKNGFKPTTQRVSEIIDMIQNFFSGIHYQYFKNRGVDVILDTGLYSIKELLEIEASKRGIIWMSFKFAIKNLERSRIEIRKYVMATNRYYVNETCINHLLELETQKWDETKRDKQNLPKQEDANNHTTDALDYAISYSQYEITNEDKFLMLHKYKKST